MVDQKMDGIRRFKFTADGNDLELVNTDFWIDYQASAQGEGQPELSLTLNSIWEHTDFDLGIGLAQRSFVEERLKELKWDFVGKKGTLIIDEGSAQEKTLNGITLTDVTTDAGELNQLIEYSITFTFPLADVSGVGGVEIARKLTFLCWPHNFMSQSEQLDLWTVFGFITVTADDLVAPDGTTTMEKVEDTSGVSVGVIRKNNAIPDDSELYEASIFVPVLSSQSDFAAFGLAFAGGTSINIAYVIDQVNGILTKSTEAGFVVAQEAKIVRHSAGFWRVSLRALNNGSGNTQAELAFWPAVNGDGSGSFITTQVGFNHAWGGQVSRVLVARTSPVPYQKTTTVAVGTTPIISDAQNYLIERTREDLTQFKEVFRASPVRIRAGKGLEELRVIGIKQNTVAAESTLLQRQEAEGVVKTWTDVVGDDGILRIDKDDAAEQQIVAHLRDAAGSDLGLPDALVFELNFATGYTE